jgi:hypothetical protein
MIPTARIERYKCSLQACSISLQGWGLIDLPLRASNEGSLRPRVARAQKIISLHPLLCPASKGIVPPHPLFFSILVAGCSESSSSKAAGESKPEAYPQGYVEDFDKPRTKLADFINSLLD